MSIEQLLEAMIEQSVLGTILIILIIAYRKLVDKLLKIVENNTEAMTKTSEALYQVKDVVKKCDGKS